MPDRKKILQEIANDHRTRQAIRAAGDGRPPALECFRDGAFIGGHVCCLTLGNYMLCKIAEIRLFRTDDPQKPVTPIDCLEVLFYISDDTRDQAVQVADDPEARGKAVARFAKSFGKEYGRSVAQELHGYLSSVFLEFNQIVPVPEQQTVTHKPAPRNLWARYVDLIAHQYHWREGFILWELPFVRLLAYHAAILERIDPEGEHQQQMDDISDDIIASLDALEEVLDDMGIKNG